MVACIAPFAPHAAEELWFQLGHHTTVHRDTWPKYDERYLAGDTVTIVVQVNGKLRSQLQLPADAAEADVTKAAQQDAKAKIFLDGKQIRKTIYVPGKLINFVM